MSGTQPVEDDDQEYDEEEEESEYEEVEEDDDGDDDEAAGADSKEGVEAQADGDDEDEEEEEEEEEVEAQPWEGLKSLPEQPEILNLFRDLVQAGRKQLTTLLLGKGGAGKSSTLNSILGEQVARVSAFKLQADTEMSTTVIRQVELGIPESEAVDGFKLKIIDTCGLEDPEAGDTVNTTALQRIAEDLQGQSVDCVLYVDRLDLYRVEPLDKGIMAAISDAFGKGIWKKTLLALTHSNLTQPPPGTTYDSFVDRRIGGLRGAVRTLLFRPKLPAVLVENADFCPVGERGKRVLPDGSEWLVDLLSAATDMALASRPYRYKPHMMQNPNRRFRWLIPAVLALQYLAWQRLIVPVIDKDLQRQEEFEDEFWRQKREVRKRWGTNGPIRPSKERAWRLEQMYDDE